MSMDLVNLFQPKSGFYDRGMSAKIARRRFISEAGKALGPEIVIH